MFNKGTCVNKGEKRLINTVWACLGTSDTHIVSSVSPSPFPGTHANPWGSGALPTRQGHTQLLGPVGFLLGLLPPPMPQPLPRPHPVKEERSTQITLVKTLISCPSCPSCPDC